MTKNILTAFLVVPMLVLFMLLIFDVISLGHQGLTFSYFFEETTRAGKSGGIGSILYSTTIIVFLALIFSSILSIMSALVLTFYISKKPALYHICDISITLLSGLPSIVFGLFGSTFFGSYLGLGYSLLSGGLTLTLMVLPFYTKILHESFKSIPREYLMSAYALDLSLLNFTRHTLLPLNMYAVLAGAIFSISRALGETAALIFTSGYVDRFPNSLFDSGRTLSVHIYDLALNVPGGDAAAARASFVMLLLSLTLNFTLNLVLKRTMNARN